VQREIPKNEVGGEKMNLFRGGRGIGIIISRAGVHVYFLPLSLWNMPLTMLDPLLELLPETIEGE